jgi:hypothetical protein
MEIGSNGQMPPPLLLPPAPRTALHPPVFPHFVVLYLFRRTFLISSSPAANIDLDGGSRGFSEIFKKAQTSAPPRPKGAIFAPAGFSRDEKSLQAMARRMGKCFPIY